MVTHPVLTDPPSDFVPLTPAHLLAELPIYLSGGWYRTWGPFTLFRWEAWAKVLGATHTFRSGFHFRDAWNDRAWQAISLSFLKDVELSPSGAPIKALEVGFANIILDGSFTAFETPRIYVTPLQVRDAAELLIKLPHA